MTKFYLVRHGMTEYNLKNRFQGGTVDSALLAESLVNARKVGQYLVDVDFAKVYSSQQKRAYCTAKEIVSQFSEPQPIHKLASFVEYNFGDWDGKLVDEYVNTAEFKQMVHDPEHFDAVKVYHGENYADFAKRGRDTLEKIFFETRKNQNVLIVAHSLIISFTVKTLLGVELNQVRKQGLLDNTSVTVLETNDFVDFTLPVWNYTNFLKN